MAPHSWSDITDPQLQEAATPRVLRSGCLRRWRLIRSAPNVCNQPEDASASQRKRTSSRDIQFDKIPTTSQ
jgi:hypothetical protein